MKRVAEFTPHQAETWMAVLGCFEVRHVNRAVVEFGMSNDPFPDLGKLVERCREYQKSEKASQGVVDYGPIKPSAVVCKVAAALELEV